MPRMKNLVAVLAFSLLLVAACTGQGQTPVEDVRIPEEVQQETVPEPQKEAIPVTPAPRQEPTPPAQIQQETTEKGGTLQEWKAALRQQTGPGSEESKTTAECEALMKQKIEECSKHAGWSVDNAMEITDFTTGKHYEFQDVKRQDCPGAAPGETPATIHVETAFLDAQTDNTRTSSYQVVCSIGCNWWDCGTDLTGTWVGPYSETAGSTYCKFKEEGTKTFKITTSDNTFTGTADYTGTSTVTGGEHCEGSTYSNKGTLSGTVSGKQVTGTIVYSGTNVPFTATVEGETLSGTYSYTTAEEAPLSGTGTFTLKKQR